jgi:hypothetical protein
MMMKSRILSMTPGASLVALAVLATALEASVVRTGPNEIHVVNSYRAPVSVYLEDGDSRLHYLGRVLPAKARSMKVESEIAAKGSFRIKVYPEAAPWNGLGQERGVRTGDVTLRDGEVVYFFVERHLSDSGILVTSG